jgi:DNA-binding LacI/PurR family transcriptional regulator
MTTAVKKTLKRGTLGSVTSRIREMALEQGPNGKLPTARELCQSLEISSVTLLRALDELEAANVVTRKDRSGIYVSSKIRYKTIAIVFSQRSGEHNVSSPFWGMLQDMLWRWASDRAPRMEHEYSFHFIPMGAAREESAARKSFEDLVMSGKVDGVLAVQPSESLQTLMNAVGVPVVGYAMGPDCGWAASYDDLQMFHLAADQLTSQGCRRIALVPAHSVVMETLVRIAEMCARMEPPIAFFRSHTLDDWQFDPANHQDFGNLAASEIFADAGNRPDGLIVLDDMVADGVIKRLLDMDIRPGRDVKIATHGNTGSSTLRGWRDRLTIIESDPARLVESMFEMLDAILCGNPPAQRAISLPWSVRLNGTTVPAG